MLDAFAKFLQRRPDIRNGETEFSTAEVARALPGPSTEFERYHFENAERAKLRPVFEVLVQLGYLEALGAPNNRSNHYRFVRGSYTLLRRRMRAGARLMKKPKTFRVGDNPNEIKREIKKLQKKLKRIESKP